MNVYSFVSFGRVTVNVAASFFVTVTVESAQLTETASSSGNAEGIPATVRVTVPLPYISVLSAVRVRG